MIILKEEKYGVSLKISVVPNSSRSMATEIIDGVLKLKLNSPPIDGRANKEVVLLLSKLVGVPKSTISIIKGDKNKLKTVLIKGDKGLLQEKIKTIKI